MYHNIIYFSHNSVIIKFEFDEIFLSILRRQCKSQMLRLNILISKRFISLIGNMNVETNELSYCSKMLHQDHQI